MTSTRDSETYTGRPTPADYQLLSEAGTESRRRFQDWISAGAIAAIVLSLELVGHRGIDRWILGAGLVFLLVSIVITAVDQALELWILLQGAKYAQRILSGEELPPIRRRILVRRIRYYAFFGQAACVVIGLVLVVVAAFTQPAQP
jgi:hypothetical protein